MKRALAALLLLAAADPRVRSVAYEPDQVVPLTGHYGYQILVELDGEERIQNISIGDSIAWAVTPNKSATGLFLKPVEPDAATNMTVQTDKRTYLFDLKAARPGRAAMTYKLKFLYPPAAPVRVAAPAAPVARNRAYTLTGAARLRPAQVFDDGRSTYFHWPPGQAVPAIFLVEGRAEALVNHRTEGAFVVVDRTARRFVLRSGADKVTVRNKGQPVPAVAGGAK